MRSYLEKKKKNHKKVLVEWLKVHAEFKPQYRKKKKKKELDQCKSAPDQRQLTSQVTP
jgi:hypothetical protein